MSIAPELHTAETYPIDSVKELEVTWDIPGCPISAEARKLLLAECPVVVDMSHVTTIPRQGTDEPLSFTEPRTIEGYDPDTVALRQPSNAHQRSFELQGEAFSTPWHDEHGNRYGAFTLKGNNFSNPGVMRHPTAIDEYIAWGLQESKIIERVLKASEALRARNVSTEYIVGLAEPQSYPFAQLGNDTTAYNLVPLAEYRRQIVERYWKTLPKPDQTFDKLVDIQSKFNDMTFYISMRATDSAYRYDDLTGGSKTRRQEVFDEINTCRLLPDEEPLSADKPADWVRYIHKYLVPNFANNLARMHVDLAHDFLHGLNITALGGIVDLDSVHGESLGFGDKPIDDLDRAKDFLQAAKTLFDESPLHPDPLLKEQTIWEFAINYAMETNLLLGEDARQQFGNIISFTEQLVDGMKPDAHVYQAITRTFREVYIDMYLKQTDEFKVQDAAFTELFNTYKFDIDELGCFDGFMTDDFLSTTTMQFIDEYISELQVGPADIAQHIFNNKNPITDAIYGEVMLRLKSMIFAQWGSLAEQNMPRLLQDLDHNVIETIYHGHCDRFRAEFDNLAQWIAPNLVSAHWDKVMELLEVEFAVPALEGTSNYNTHESDRLLWAMTEAVSVFKAMTYLEDTTPLELVESHDIVFNKDISVGFVEIKDGKSIYEVITNVSIGSFVYDDKHLRVDVEGVPDDEPAYAMVIRQDNDGKKRYELHMLPDQRETIHDSAYDEMLFED